MTDEHATVLMRGKGRPCSRRIPSRFSTRALRQAPRGRVCREPTARWITPIHRSRSAARALTPGSLLDARERARPRPPWVWPVATPRDQIGVARNSREWLTNFLLYMGTSDYLEMSTQLWQRVGVEYACPLYDQRVLRAALRLPVDLRVPFPYPKPVLGALLAEHAESRVKADSATYMGALADSSAATSRGSSMGVA